MTGKYQKAYRQKMAQEGIVQRSFMIPSWAVSEVSEFCKRLRESTGNNPITDARDSYIDELEQQVETLKTEIKQLKGI